MDGFSGIMNEWDVPCADAETGKQVTIRFKAMWSPEKDGTTEAVARSAAATHSVETKRKHLPLGAPVYIGRVKPNKTVPVIPTIDNPTLN